MINHRIWKRTAGAAVTLGFCVLMLGGALRAQEPTDVPPGHWAYKAIGNLIDRGYLALYSDGTFRGDQPVSRYVFAAAVDKLISEVRGGAPGAPGAPGLTSDDVKQVQQLLTEFRGDVSDYDVKIQRLEARLADIESGRVGLQKDVADVTFDFKEDMADLTDAVKRNNEFIVSLQRDMGEMNDKVARLQSDLAAERKQRKSTDTILFVLVVAAGVVAASN